MPTRCGGALADGETRFSAEVNPVLPAAKTLQSVGGPGVASLWVPRLQFGASGYYATSDTVEMGINVRLAHGPWVFANTYKALAFPDIHHKLVGTFGCGFRVNMTDRSRPVGMALLAEYTIHYIPDYHESYTVEDDWPHESLNSDVVEIGAHASFSSLTWAQNGPPDFDEPFVERSGRVGQVGLGARFNLPLGQTGITGSLIGEVNVETLQQHTRLEHQIETEIYSFVLNDMTGQVAAGSEELAVDLWEQDSRLGGEVVVQLHGSIGEDFYAFLVIGLQWKQTCQRLVEQWWTDCDGAPDHICDEIEVDEPEFPPEWTVSEVLLLGAGLEWQSDLMFATAGLIYPLWFDRLNSQLLLHLSVGLKL